jgi:1-deoxy-D-xylulose-5-phosphate synthase
MTFSAGLAASGYIPFVGIYSTFLQRCYDNLLHDVCLQNLPVKIMIDRAGLAPGDGATHHGIFDVSFISHIPEMTLLAPASYKSLCEMTEKAISIPGPVAIRYPNARENAKALDGMKAVSTNINSRVFIDFNETPDYVFITYGQIIGRVREAEKMLHDKGYSVGVILVETLKPYKPTAELIYRLTDGAKRILYVEEGIKNGGAAETTRGALLDLGFDINKTEYRIAAIDDNFASPSELCDIYDFAGLSGEKLADRMIN